MKVEAGQRLQVILVVSAKEDNALGKMVAVKIK